MWLFCYASMLRGFVSFQVDNLYDYRLGRLALDLFYPRRPPSLSERSIAREKTNKLFFLIRQIRFFFYMYVCRYVYTHFFFFFIYIEYTYAHRTHINYSFYEILYDKLKKLSTRVRYFFYFPIKVS